MYFALLLLKNCCAEYFLCLASLSHVASYSLVCSMLTPLAQRVPECLPWQSHCLPRTLLISCSGWSSLLCTPCAKGQLWIMQPATLCTATHTHKCLPLTKCPNIRVFLCIRAAAASLNKDSTGSRITVCCLAH